MVRGLHPMGYRRRIEGASDQGDEAVRLDLYPQTRLALPAMFC